MLIDLHAHSSGISRCCRVSAPDVLRIAREHGMDGVVLTNHYYKGYITGEDTAAAFAQRYVEEYRYAKRCGEELGVSVFFGIEITMAQHGEAHLLVYGVDEEFPCRYPELFDMTQKDLYAIVKEHGGIVVQAHPYRQNIDRLLDVAYLDGIEINCHPVYEGTHRPALTEIALANHLILTSGGDYHGDIYRVTCGVYLPDTVKSSRDIRDYLCSTDEIRLCVQEVGDHTAQDVVYRRHGADEGNA